MMYGIDYFKQEQYKKGKLETIKKLFDVLDVEIIAEKFEMTIEEVEALKELDTKSEPSK